jgi:hypothetical protein
MQTIKHLPAQLCHTTEAVLVLYLLSPTLEQTKQLQPAALLTAKYFRMQERCN